MWKREYCAHQLAEYGEFWLTSTIRQLLQFSPKCDRCLSSKWTQLISRLQKSSPLILQFVQIILRDQSWKLSRSFTREDMARLGDNASSGSTHEIMDNTESSEKSKRLRIWTHSSTRNLTQSSVKRVWLSPSGTLHLSIATPTKMNFHDGTMVTFTCGINGYMWDQ